ncbi:MAG: hypothetical protein AMXMBFR61_08340 [Fimbriimonadales bacterium]
MAQALRNVREVEKLSEKLSGRIPKIYGGLCHKLPVLVRACGLCQTVAFLEAKSESKDRERAEAYLRMCGHVKEMLEKHGGVKVAAQTLSEAVAGLEIREYSFATRCILQAWVFYKRFAESILKVANAQEDEHGS